MAVELNLQDVVAVRLNFRDSLQTTAYNVLHYRLANAVVAGGGEFDGADFAEIGPSLAENAFTILAANWADAASSRVNCTGTSVWNVWPLPRSAGYHHVPVNPTSGTVIGDALPLQDSATILKRTAFGARWGLGRLFFVGLGESQQADGVLTAGAVADINTFAAALALVLDFTVAGVTYSFVPVLHSITKPPVVTASTHNIISFDLSDPILKTQRRRRPGKGI